MKLEAKLITFAAAVVISAAAIVPTSGVKAQGWVSVRNNNQPMVEGSGRIVRQNRVVPAFRRVETLGSAIVEVRLGSAHSLSIAADDNILPLLTAEVKKGALVVAGRGSYRTREPIRIWITTPTLEAFRTAGSGDVTISGVNNDRLALTIDGSGTMRATGRTRRLDLAIRGSGNANLAALAVGDADAGLYGSGNATVRVSGELDARVIGSGDLRYVGRPAALRQQRIGSGRISANAN